MSAGMGGVDLPSGPRALMPPGEEMMPAQQQPMISMQPRFQQPFARVLVLAVAVLVIVVALLRPPVLVLDRWCNTSSAAVVEPSSTLHVSTVATRRAA